MASSDKYSEIRKQFLFTAPVWFVEELTMFGVLEQELHNGLGPGPHGDMQGCVT